MAKVIVEIDLPDDSYEYLKENLIDNPNPDFFENQDVSTGRITIDNVELREDPYDDSFYTFKLIDVKE